MTDKKLPPKWLKHTKKASQIEMPSTFLVYGASGVGKTTLAASASKVKELSPVLIIDIEGSATGVGRMYPDVDVISAPRFEQFDEVITDLIEGNGHGYKTIIIDTLNALQRAAKVHAESLPKNKSNTYGVWGDLDAYIRDTMISMHNDLPDVLTFWTAHPQQEKDEGTGKMIYGIELQGKATKPFVPTLPDVIGFMQYEDTDEGTQRILIVGKSERHVTKNRFGLSDVIVEPTMQKIIDAIKKDQKKEEK